MKNLKSIFAGITFLFMTMFAINVMAQVITPPSSVFDFSVVAPTLTNQVAWKSMNKTTYINVNLARAALYGYLNNGLNQFMDYNIGGLNIINFFDKTGNRCLVTYSESTGIINVSHLFVNSSMTCESPASRVLVINDK